MPMTLDPSLREVLHLHELLLERHGGLDGVRDLGMLESALHRPRSGYYNSLCEQGAALLQSLANNHAFLDGNKRVAFATAAVFLHENGLELEVETAEGESFMIESVIQARVQLDVICGWLEQHTEPVLT